MGNTFVIVVMSSRSLRKQLVNVFLINQSCLDLAASLMAIATSPNKANASGIPNDLGGNKLRWCSSLSQNRLRSDPTLMRGQQLVHAALTYQDKKIGVRGHPACLKSRIQATSADPKSNLNFKKETSEMEPRGIWDTLPGGRGK